jgi:hypothetical protein
LLLFSKNPSVFTPECQGGQGLEMTLSLPKSQTKSSTRSGCSPRSSRLASCRKEDAATSQRKGTASLVGGRTRGWRTSDERRGGGARQTNDAAAVLIGERSRPPSTAIRETSIEAENSLGWGVVRKEETNGDAASHYQHVFAFNEIGKGTNELSQNQLPMS